MATYNITGIGGLTSKTWYPMPPIEWARAGAAVATLSVINNGTGGGTDGLVSNKETTSVDNGTGLKVDLTIASNVCTTAVPNTGGNSRDGEGYRLGDRVTVSSNNATTTADVVLEVIGLQYE